MAKLIVRVVMLVR